jgi:hypothetical protein
MEEIYIVVTHTGTILSRIIKKITKNEYTHVSISLDKELNYMYSFGRLNPYNPFIGGFVHEGINFGTFKRFKLTNTSVYAISVSKEQYLRAIANVRNIERNKDKYHFNIIGLIAVAFKKKLAPRKSFYCAEFVKYILNEAGIENNLPEIVKPEDFKKLPNSKLIYKGKLRKYNKKSNIQIISLEELLRRKSTVG